MKKYHRLLCALSILVALVCCVTMPLRANAQEESELRTVMVSVYVQSGASVAENELVDVYFENTATGEEYKFTLKGNNTGVPIHLPEGEYRVKQATLADRPEVAFQTSVSKLVVDDSENIFFTLSLKNVLVSDENKDEVENSISEFEKEKVTEFMQGLGVLLWLTLGIVSLVYTLRGRRCKDSLKAAFLQAKGKITRHVFFGVMCAFILGSLFGDSNKFSWFGGIMGFGIPFGIYALAPAYDAILKSQQERREVDPNNTSGDIALFVVMLVIAALLGVLLIPVTFTRDTISIVKTYRAYKNRNQ